VSIALILWLSFISKHRYWSDREQVARFSCLKAVDKCNRQVQVNHWQIQLAEAVVSYKWHMQVTDTSGICNWPIVVARLVA
jgi:hypothetical protein